MRQTRHSLCVSDRDQIPSLSSGVVMCRGTPHTSIDEFGAGCLDVVNDEVDPELNPAQLGPGSVAATKCHVTKLCRERFVQNFN